jgi:hypothetical protein
LEKKNDSFQMSISLIFVFLFTFIFPGQWMRVGLVLHFPEQ